MNFFIALVAVLLFFAWTPPAEAYLDPGTGSLILQAIIGTIVGALVAIRVYWNKIKLFLRRKGSAGCGNDEPADTH